MDLELTKMRKRKKKDQSEKACPEVEGAPLEAQEETNEKGSKKKKKQKKKKSKTLENEIDVKEEVPADKADVKSNSNENPDIEPSQGRKFPNGLAVEELEPGYSDGKIAVRGKKVKIMLFLVSAIYIFEA